MTFLRRFAPLALAALAIAALAPPAAAGALEDEARAALERLYETDPDAAKLEEKAAAVLVFPEIVKGGVIIGGAGGDGVLFRGGEPAGRYRSIAASWGLQFGISKFGYAMMFLDEAALDYMKRSDGWEIGVGPSVVVADEGWAGRFSTSTEEPGVVVFFFDQTGFFAGGGVEGTKITPLE